MLSWMPLLVSGALLHLSFRASGFAPLEMRCTFDELQWNKNMEGPVESLLSGLVLGNASRSYLTHFDVSFLRQSRPILKGSLPPSGPL